MRKETTTGAFAVFGITVARAARLARSALWLERAKDPHFKIDENMEAETKFQLKNAKTLKISPYFSAPQFCEDWIELAKKTQGEECRRMVVMQHAPKLNKAGKEMLQKKTGKTVLTWERYEK